MSDCIKTLSIDVSALPVTESLYAKIFHIVKKRVEDRCATRCTANDATASFVLRFVLDKSVPAEGFRLTDVAEGNGVVVSGADFLSLMYGAGQFLHKSHYVEQGIIPTDWRGESVPQTSKRMVFFAQHFYNWYQCCSPEEIREHIEDLVLWGINGVVSVFSCLNLTGWDDPNLDELVELFRKTLSAARELKLKIGIEYSNVDFMVPRKDVSADKKYLCSQTGNLICPSTEEGFAYYQQMLAKILDYTDEFGGLDFITIWSYDEGGCSCDKCWPWGGKGFYNMAHRISKYIKSRYPKIEIWLATWYFGRLNVQKEEWPMLYSRLQEDSAKGDNWADYLLMETRDYYPEIYYPIEHGQPTKHTKLLTFPEISMTGLTPWGGMGAICTPTLIKRQEKPFAPHCDGGYLYTEGIFDDMNKAIMLGLYWNRQRSTEETLTDYCGYEFKGIDPADLIHLVDLIEASQLYTNRFDRKPCPLSFCELAWELAEKMNLGASKDTQKYWRWRIVYIRAYLDLVRYRNCAKAGWPLQKVNNMRFWRRFLENDKKAQDFLLELIHLYKAQEIDDPIRYAYHWFVRPPMTRGANIVDEPSFEDTKI